MKCIIYNASFDDCSVSFPIMFIINREFVLIGPEFKKGVQPAISYKDYLQVIENHVEPNKKCDDFKCLDMWDALKENFYFYDIDPPLKAVMSLYFWVADKTNSLSCIPEPIKPLMTSLEKYNYDLYVAKFITADLSKVDISKSRDVYFSTLAGNPSRIVHEKDFSASCFISKYTSGVISKVGIVNFDKTVKKVIKNIEKFAKFYNFLHGKTHIGHVTQDGNFIDFGDSFGMRELPFLLEYLDSCLSIDLVKKAKEKAQIHDIDVAAACTLMEVYRFLDSMHTQNFLEHKNKIAEIKKWIIKVLTKYFNSDVSIFTMLREDSFVFDGGCEFGDLPPYQTINEQFPTYYLMKKFFE